MSLSQALSTAMAGLRVTQSQLSVVSGNVANAQTPGYVRKTLDQVTTAAGGGISVTTAAIQRELDQLVQTQLRTETSGASYATALSQLYQQIQQVIGQPGSSTGIDSLFNNFTSALQTLSSTPDSYSAQTTALNAGQVLAQQLNATTQALQTLRGAAEQGISSDIQQANDALQQIVKINKQLIAASPDDPSAATLMDQRDHYIDQLSQLMDIRVVQGQHNDVSIYTGNGFQLADASSATQLSFDPRGTITASSAWDADPSKSGVGSIKIINPDGSSTDLIAQGAIKSGEIAAYLAMRDQILPQAQSQIDEFAAQMSRALSDRTTDGATVTGPPAGFSIDTANLLNGNTINLTYTDSATNTQHVVTIVRVDDPSALPLPSTTTADPNDQVIGVNFSGGMSSVVSQLTAALGATGLQFSNPSGTTLQVVDDGATNRVDVNALSSTVTTTGLTTGNPQLPFFLDGATPFSGAIGGSGAQITGLAGRITVNPALLANPSSVVIYQSGGLIGDTTRPSFLYSQLTNASYVYSPQTGIGGSASPFTGTLSSFVSQIFAQQGQAAANAASLKQGQDLVVSALQQRMTATSGVNIDQEMTDLLTLQNAYGANARVFTVVKQMFDTLLNM